MSRLVITNCHLIDSLSDHAQPDASVAIEDGLITRIETNNTKIDPDGATVNRCPRWLAAPGSLGRTRAPHVPGSPTQDHPPTASSNMAITLWRASPKAESPASVAVESKTG